MLTGFRLMLMLFNAYSTFVDNYCVEKSQVFRFIGDQFVYMRLMRFERGVAMDIWFVLG